MSKNQVLAASQKSNDKWSWEVVSSEFYQHIGKVTCEKPQVIENPLIRNYLIKICTGCTETPCLNCHKGQKLRREVISLGGSRWNYKPKKCANSNCRNNRCQFAHTSEEIFYHPILFRTLPCKFSLINGVCSKYGSVCPFIHKETIENTDPLLSGKTEVFDLCTFKTVKCCRTGSHDYKHCVYYHGVDKRRSQDTVQYDCEMCENPKKCKNRDQCNKCHSEAELLFHSESYKKRQCMAKNCILNEFCPFYHEPWKEAALLSQSREIECIGIVKRCSELNALLAGLQEKNRKLAKFMCHFCFENKSQVILCCGHAKCQGCSLDILCSICGKATQPIVDIKFIS